MATENLLKEDMPAEFSGEKDPMLADQKGTDMMQEGATVTITRPVYTQDELVRSYDLTPDPPISCRDTTRACCQRNCACSGSCLKKAVLGKLPFIEIMRNYQWKKWIVGDIIAGLSIGVIHIPQGMGFALLTQLPAVYGLYSSFWPVLFYFFFGTSRHISLGTMALISIMIGSIITDQLTAAGLSDDVEVVTGPNITDTNATDVVQFKVGIAMSATLLMGIFQIAMSIFRLGIIATFMSMPFVGSFMTGAAINIITSQLPTLFQIKLPPHGAMFKTPVTIIDLFKNITQTNVASLVTGLICIIILYVLKEIINDRYRKKLKVPIPAELLVVIIGTLISHYAKFNELWGVKVIGEIPRGIPAPTVPSMYNWQSYIGQCVIIAIVSFAISISMAKLMSRKHNYPIDTNQELLAYGLSYGIGSFFYAFGGAQAPPRTVVQDFTNGKTQLAGLVSCILLLLVCLALGPLFRNLPNCVLAAIIIVALIPLLKSFRDLKNLWKVNKYDCLTWIVTIVCTVFFDISIGLVAGIGFNILTIAIQSLLAKGDVVAEIDHTGLYVEANPKFEHVKSASGVRSFRFHSSLYFVNVESFRLQLYKKTVNPKAQKEKTEIDAKNKDAVNGKVADEVCDADSTIDMDNLEINANGPAPVQPDLHTIILDCSELSYIDIMGLNLLKQLKGDYTDAGIKLVLAECRPYLLTKLKAADLIKEDGTSSIEIYPTVHDAISSQSSHRF